MKTTMPPGRAGTLSDTDYVDLLAAILEANGFAPGSKTVLPEKLQAIVFGSKP
jgi:hypothetical protein